MPHSPPRPRLRDHLRVLGLFATSLLGAIPFILHVLVSPVATPLARRRLRRLLATPPPAPASPPAPDAKAWAGKTVFVVAGEPSGDRLAARVVSAIRRAAPGVRVRGFGGPALAAAGADLDRDIVAHAVMGFYGVVASLGFWWRLCVEALATFRDDPPDVLLTVDFPGLNLRLARWARSRGIPTVHLVAPQTWAWASWRTRRMRRAADCLLVTFPFEEGVFRAAGVRADFVGHPLFEAPLPPPQSPEALPDSPLVELRPGSRLKEVRRQASVVLAAAAALSDRVPSARFVARLATEEGANAFRAIAASAPRAPSDLAVEVGPASPSTRIALAITTSGTSTAELAAQQVPMVVFYRVSVGGRLFAATLVTSPFFAMANVLAGREIVPERFVGGGDQEALAAAAAALLSDPARWASVRAALGEVRARIAHPDVADRVARAVLASRGTERG